MTMRSVISLIVMVSLLACSNQSKSKDTDGVIVQEYYRASTGLWEEYFEGTTTDAVTALEKMERNLIEMEKLRIKGFPYDYEMAVWCFRAYDLYRFVGDQEKAGSVLDRAWVFAEREWNVAKQTSDELEQIMKEINFRKVPKWKTTAPDN